MQRIKFDQRSVVIVVMKMSCVRRLFGYNMTLLLLILWCNLSVSLGYALRLLPSPIHARKLQAGIPYKIQIFLSLDYLNDTIAVLFESANMTSSNDVTSHFCFAVNTQVRSAQVGSISIGFCSSHLVLPIRFT
jgi:uncharacterized membrane protein (DUF485 family)